MHAPSGRAVQQPARGAGSADSTAFRAALSRFPTGVTLLTTRADGMHQGLTANSFTSVSLAPPLVLVCVQRSARFHDLVLRSGVWGVSVLTAGMEQVSARFAQHGRPWRADQFEPFPHRTGRHTGCLLLRGAAATFECRTWSTSDGGDHTVVVGEVLDFADGGGDAVPLVYADGDYRDLPAEGGQATATQDSIG